MEVANSLNCRNQPIIFSELYRYGFYKAIKPSNGLFVPEKTYYKPSSDAVHQVSTPEMDASLEKLAKDFFIMAIRVGNSCRIRSNRFVRPFGPSMTA